MVVAWAIAAELALVTETLEADVVVADEAAADKAFVTGDMAAADETLVTDAAAETEDTAIVVDTAFALAATEVLGLSEVAATAGVAITTPCESYTDNLEEPPHISEALPVCHQLRVKQKGEEDIPPQAEEHCESTSSPVVGNDNPQKHCTPFSVPEYR